MNKYLNTCYMTRLKKVLSKYDELFLHLLCRFFILVGTWKDRRLRKL